MLYMICHQCHCRHRHPHRQALYLHKNRSDLFSGCFCLRQLSAAFSFQPMTLPCEFLSQNVSFFFPRLMKNSFVRCFAGLDLSGHYLALDAALVNAAEDAEQAALAPRGVPAVRHEPKIFSAVLVRSPPDDLHGVAAHVRAWWHTRTHETRDIHRPSWIVNCRSQIISSQQ